MRMLRKRPVLTAAALFALTFGIPVSMVPGHVVDVLEAPLPEDTNDRIRSLRYWDQSRFQPAPTTYFEFGRWRSELETFDRLGAFRSSSYNLQSEGGQAEIVSGAEVTASSFDLLGATPVAGRVFDRSDERPGASDVVVLGYDLWRRRLDGDPHVVGTTLEVAGVLHTIVGVMGEGFLFPSRQQLWVPLREELLTAPGQGRELNVFGRLADGISPEDAHAEVAALGDRMAEDFPNTSEHLEAEVVRFGTAAMMMPRGGWSAMPDSLRLSILSLVLLGVACANVAMLIFASTATRLRELAIRTSLGASRLRIVSQLFVECLVLAVSAAGLGLIGFHVLAQWLRRVLLASDLPGFPPYWLHFGLDAEMVVGVVAVAALSASIAGGLPALRVTGRKVQESLRRSEAGSSGIRFGGVTSALIVVDVAIAVAVVGLAVGAVGQVGSVLSADERVGIVAEEFLAVEMSLPAKEVPPVDDQVLEEAPADKSVASSGEAHTELKAQLETSGLARIQRTLVDRLLAEPRVRAVAVADSLPRQHPNFRRYSLDGETTWLTVEGRPGATAPPLLPVVRVDIDYFDALGHSVLAGRGFDHADLGDNVSTAIVNTRFVERRLGGRNPIGRRFRFWNGHDMSVEPEERWYEIVGVVGPLGINVGMPEQDAGVYLPAAPGEIDPLRLAVHVSGNPQTFAPRLREIVSDIEPRAILEPPLALDRIVQAVLYFLFGIIACLSILVGILVALAASGIYAIMSFAVSERTREIGIRRSLGEGTAALALRIGRRALVQITVGAVLGVWPAMQLYRLMELGYKPPTATAGLGAAVAAGVGVALLIGTISCVSPTRRALEINPSEALRAEG